MSGTAIVTAIIEIMVSGLAGIGQGIGTALSTLASSIFLQTTEGVTTLSVFGSLVVVWSAIALGLSLCRLVVAWITSLGNSRNM